jgi:hypothetical protein
MATGKIKVNFKMPTPSAADRMNAKHQAIRKAAGLPDVDNNPDRPDAGKYSSGSSKPVKRVTPVATPSVNEEDITVVKKGSGIKKKISDISYNVFKSHGFVKESFRIGGMGSRGANVHMYDRNPGPRDGSELENIPSRPKTELQKRLKAALADFGDKMKKTHPKLRESKDSQEYDYEGDMAKSDLRSIMHHAKELHDMIEDTTNLAEWCQSKITLSEDYLSTVANYMRSEMNEETIEEDKNDYQRKIEKNNKNFIAASKRQKNPLTNVHTAQTKQKPVKEEVEQLDEKKKLPGLWANIHAKRKRGESPAKPGDKDYPKTLNIESMNEDDDPCWKDYKMVGMKNKNGRKVPNCVPKENVSSMKKEGVQDDPKADQMTTDDNKFPKKSRKAEIVRAAAKKMPAEDQFQAKPVLDSQVAQQTNK